MLQVVLALLAILLFSAKPADAASGPVCDAYVEKAVKAAKDVRTLACGFDLGHPQWSTDPNVHRRWCRSADQDSVNAQSSDREYRLLVCRTCRAYTNAATKAAADNVIYGCGFTGPRWDTDPKNHFNWCMGLKAKDPVMLGVVHLWKPLSISLNPETSARTQAIEECKLTNQPRNCISCHSAHPPVSTSRGSSVRTVLRPQSQRAVTGGKPKENVTPTVKAGTSSATQNKPLAPGLLEGGGGLGTQGPAATGAPMQTAPSQWRGSGGSGSGLR
jgi:hypothetical protein